MNKNEFEYNYYFELYKEKTTLCHKRFKKRFKKDHPNTKINLDKLIVEIERYQINKYGNIKFSDYFIERVNAKKEKENSRQRYKYKLNRRNAIKGKDNE